MQLSIPEIDHPGDLTSQQQVYLRLRNAILTGALAPGTALTMRGVAANLGCSSTPVREALRRLAQESAVCTLGNRRMEVPQMCRERFENLIAARISLEGHAGLRALPFVSDHLIGQLTQIDREMDQALLSADLDALTCLNLEFHRALYCADPSQVVLPLIESIWLQLGPFQRQAIRSLKAFYAEDRHKQVLAALRQRDKGLLLEAIERDIEEGVGRAGRLLLGQMPVTRPKYQ